MPNYYNTPNSQPEQDIQNSQPNTQIKANSQQYRHEIKDVMGDWTKQFEVGWHTLKFVQHWNLGVYDVYLDWNSCWQTASSYSHWFDRTPVAIWNKIYYVVIDHKSMPQHEVLDTETLKIERLDNISDIFDVNGTPLFIKRLERYRDGILQQVSYKDINFWEYLLIWDINWHDIDEWKDKLSFTIDEDWHIWFVWKTKDGKYVFVYEDESDPKWYTQIWPFDEISFNKNKNPEQETVNTTEQEASNGLERIKDLQPKFKGLDFSNYTSITDTYWKKIKGDRQLEVDIYKHIWFIWKTNDGKYEFIYEDKSDSRWYTQIWPYDKIIIYQNGNYPTVKWYNIYTIESDDKSLRGIIGKNEDTTDKKITWYKLVYNNTIEDLRIH